MGPATSAVHRHYDSFAVASSGLVGYTDGMKVSISLPDELFRAAERHARRTRKSRSQLYADALAEHLVRHAPEEVTDAMNRVVEQLGKADADAFVGAAGRRVLERTEW
jgi:predicted transcriptional regulator